MNLISVIIDLIILILGVWVLYRGYKKGMEFSVPFFVIKIFTNSPTSVIVSNVVIDTT